MDINSLEEKLNNISKLSKNIDLELDYKKANEKYKTLISGFSLAYLEMSDFYYGEELPYDIYCKENNKQLPINSEIDLKGTYFDTKEDIIELYKLFIFYGYFEFMLNSKKWL